jgi:hypothetical protein
VGLTLQDGLNNLKRNSMTVDRIKEIQSKTAFPDSVSVCQALLQVWNECVQERMYSEEDLRQAYIVGKHGGVNQTYYDFDEWFKQFKKK